MRWVVGSVVIAVVLLLFAVGTILLLRRHSRVTGAPGSAAWRASDIFGAAALVASVVVGVSFAIASLTVFGAGLSRPGVTPTQGTATRPVPTPSPSRTTPSAGDISRLEEGSDVSLFLEVLGEPGYRRVIEATEGEAPSQREWGWARRDVYMVRAIVSQENQVEAFSVTSLSPSFQPAMPHFADIASRPLTIGATTFEQFSGAFDVRVAPNGRAIDPPAANGRWNFSEYYYIPNPLYRMFVLSHGFTGSGFRLDDDLPMQVSDALGDCEVQPCLGKVKGSAVLREARGKWPVTTFSVLGDVAEITQALNVLAREPLDDDIRAADRG